jgi:hypothetical protein
MCETMFKIKLSPKLTKYIKLTEKYVVGTKADIKICFRSLTHEFEKKLLGRHPSNPRDNAQIIVDLMCLFMTIDDQTSANEVYLEIRAMLEKFILMNTNHDELLSDCVQKKYENINVYLDASSIEQRNICIFCDNTQKITFKDLNTYFEIRSRPFEIKFDKNNEILDA